LIENDLVIRAMSKLKYLTSNPTLEQRRVLIECYSALTSVSKVLNYIGKTLENNDLDDEGILVELMSENMMNGARLLIRNKLVM